MEHGDTEPSRRSIALVGFMGAGKTRVGRMLAERLQLPFLDTDQAIETSFGLPVAAIFQEKGEAAFRDAERQLIARLLRDEARVIALGGGAFADPRNREALNRGALTIWLDTPLDLIFPRLARSSSRPLALGRSEAELRALWEERRQHYARAQLRIDTSHAEPEHVVDRIVRACAEKGVRGQD